MTQNEIFEKFKNLIVEKLEGVNPDAVTMNAGFFKDLHADSMDVFDIIDQVKDEFGLEEDISLEDANHFEKVGDVVAYIEKKI